MVKIVTDSTCDLNAEQARQLGVDAIAKLYVRFGRQTFVDGVTISNEQFSTMMKENPNFPSTSQPSIGDFVKIYEQFKGEPIVSIHVSRELSGTIASAEAAREMVGGDITIIDSRNVNAGLSLVVAEAARMAHQGAAPAQIQTRIEALVPRTRLVFTLDTLENLRRGGRIGAVQAIVGGVLQFKPIIAVKEGRLEPLERVRTMPKAVARMREIALTDLQNQAEAQVWFMHSAAPDLAQELMTSTARLKTMKNPLLIEAGPVVATHAGPGAVGIAYII
ncbi:MAG TPA: DegV family protein [Anaerolineae bacterium]